MRIYFLKLYKKIFACKFWSIIISFAVQKLTSDRKMTISGGIRIFPGKNIFLWCQIDMFWWKWIKNLMPKT